ncbi:MAG: hypothetical protein EOO52_18180 [Gammaproteobacteria bacterium]|nr:MAG: hypothetical protein EOO52_18180 [Gammaproteobacteria bacterium]
MAQIVKVLIVTDGGGGFKHSIKIGGQFFNAFHLGEFVDVLQETDWNGFSLQITKAHRENVVASDIGADLVNFKFDAHDLSVYDEILLFPILRDGDSIAVPAGQPFRSSNATDAEVKAIAEFMDAGGGVFATGDHEDLGAGLCSRLPRIRNMRRWYWDTAGPNGEPVAPSGSSANRYDTVRAGHDYDSAHPNDNYQFDDQSDNIAQKIAPEIFEVRSSRYIRQRWPHPVLCSPEGMVRYLPDHAHEGRCEVPANMGLNVTVAGYNQQEYPPLLDGTALEPVVVAYATVIGGHATDAKPVVNARTFGVIGAYDGHRTRRAGKTLGRVVVDATWHHFFNINLTGDLNSPTPAKRLGFNAPLLPGQQDHYKMIKHYFRNIVYWLIPSRRRRWLVHHLLTTMVRDAQFYELNPIAKIRDFTTVNLDHIFALAKLADAYFKQAHGACYTLQILPIILYEIDPLRKFWERFEPTVNPWIAEREKKTIPINLDQQLVVDTILGSSVLAALQAKNDLDSAHGTVWNEDITQKSFELFEKHLPEMLSIGTTHFSRKIQGDIKNAENFISDVKDFSTSRQSC